LKKFLIKAILFTFICVGTVIGVSSFEGSGQDINNSYMAAIIDKHARLDSITNNRLILVGGSNLAFSINSEMLQKNTGKNVVNLGLHAGLGSEFIINEIERNLKKNDVVLLNFEYSLYDDSYVPYNDLISFIQKIYPSSKAYYQLGINQNLEVYFGDFIKKITEKRSNINISPYYRTAFNNYGDDTAHLNMKSLKSLSGSLVMNKIKLNLIVNRLKELNLKCREKNVKLFLLYPDYAKTEFNLNYEVIKDLQKQIEKNIGFIKVINTPETFVFDDDLFFDTVYHLNKKGRELRTVLLLKILNENLTEYSREK
jgi:hypothetical protein